MKTLTSIAFIALISVSGAAISEEKKPVLMDPSKMEGMDHSTMIKPTVDESKPHVHAKGAEHKDAKSAVKTPVDESKPHVHAKGDGHNATKPPVKPAVKKPVDESKPHDHLPE